MISPDPLDYIRSIIQEYICYAEMQDISALTRSKNGQVCRMALPLYHITLDDPIYFCIVDLSKSNDRRDSQALS